MIHQDFQPSKEHVNDVLLKFQHVSFLTELPSYWMNPKHLFDWGWSHELWSFSLISLRTSDYKFVNLCQYDKFIEGFSLRKIECVYQLFRLQRLKFKDSFDSIQSLLQLLCVNEILLIIFDFHENKQQVCYRFLLKRCILSRGSI